MMRRCAVALRELAVALRELARTTLLFRLRGRRAVSREASRAMKPPTASEDAPSPGRADILPAVRAVDRAQALWPLPVACLQRALVLQIMLGRQGVASAVRVGSRFVDGEFAAHAWVEAGSHVLDEHGEAPDFAPFPVPEGKPRDGLDGVEAATRRGRRVGE